MAVSRVRLARYGARGEKRDLGCHAVSQTACRMATATAATASYLAGSSAKTTRSAPPTESSVPRTALPKPPFPYPESAIPPLEAPACTSLSPRLTVAPNIPNPASIEPATIPTTGSRRASTRQPGNPATQRTTRHRRTDPQWLSTRRPKSFSDHIGSRPKIPARNAHPCAIPANLTLILASVLPGPTNRTNELEPPHDHRRDH